MKGNGKFRKQFPKRKLPSNVSGMQFDGALFKIGDVFKIRDQHFVVHNFIPQFNFMNLQWLPPAKVKELLEKTEAKRKSQNVENQNNEEHPEQSL